ncbi:MAG: metal-sensing transcriptional repressor [Clostridia bacterium]|nr:metal-sensing transcriptional repressor [Clostridia bacterium]
MSKEAVMEKHEHEHEHTKAVLNRMSRAIGHMNAVKRMVEEGRDCSEVLIQLSAVRAEISNLSKVILKDHIDHCIVEAVKQDDEEAIEHLKGAIDKLI